MNFGDMRRNLAEIRRWLSWPAAVAIGSMLPAIALAQAPADSDILLKLPRDLSPWGMFLAADIVVKAVMVGLVFASVLTWTIWFAKAHVYRFASLGAHCSPFASRCGKPSVIFA